ncbi:coiled-coil and C2 domain-containing protein 1-like isoform X1 [Vespula maculifrons]|uniref:Coiled-coil and C2 domain-containing protein 1-like isoform X1 n=1 Tax=Vespula maculifrons TaxID=7453 RepID=A0ABD2CWX5_VESMC
MLAEPHPVLHSSKTNVKRSFSNILQLSYAASDSRTCLHEHLRASCSNVTTIVLHHSNDLNLFNENPVVTQSIRLYRYRGFFRSDSLLGTVTVKLQSLEMQCILHDSFPLMEGRKPTGGKLELKIRLRNPILTKQIEQITDKWLIIDN